MSNPKGTPENMEYRHVKLNEEYIKTHFGDGTDSARQIAQVLGCHPDSVRRAARRLGIHRPIPKPQPEQLLKADQLLDGTIPFAEVANTVGLTRNMVSGRFRGRGLNPENVGTYNSARRMEESLGL